MKHALFVLFFLISYGAGAQNVPRLSKVPIGNSGCSAYFPGTPEKAALDYSPDSSLVYTMESEVDSFYFGTILVKLKEPMEEDDIEGVLKQYLDYLKDAFKIKDAAGYGMGHTLKTHAAAKGMIDYWKDEEGDEWRVKAWADKQYIAVMYEYGPIAYPIENVVQMFFDGIRFPGD